MSRDFAEMLSELSAAGVDFLASAPMHSPPTGFPGRLAISTSGFGHRATTPNARWTRSAALGDAPE